MRSASRSSRLCAAATAGFDKVGDAKAVNPKAAPPARLRANWRRELVPVAQKQCIMTEANGHSSIIRPCRATRASVGEPQRGRNAFYWLLVAIIVASCRYNAVERSVLTAVIPRTEYANADHHRLPAWCSCCSFDDADVPHFPNSNCPLRFRGRAIIAYDADLTTRKKRRNCASAAGGSFGSVDSVRGSAIL